MKKVLLLVSIIVLILIIGIAIPKFFIADGDEKLNFCARREASVLFDHPLQRLLTLQISTKVNINSRGHSEAVSYTLFGIPYKQFEFDCEGYAQPIGGVIPLSNTPTRQSLILGAPRLVQIMEDTGLVEITWDKNIAEKYELYRSKNNQANWEKVGELDNIMHSSIDNLVKSGMGTYYYKIIAIDINGKIIQESPVSSITVNFPDYEKEAQKPFQRNDLYDYFGTLILTGYLKVEKIICNPGDMCEKTREYATFIFNESTRKEIYDYLGKNSGNAFVGEQSIGLGCYEKDVNRIYSQNLGDDGLVENNIDGLNLVKLLNSSESNQVKLQLTKPIYTSGRGAPDCYSHFRLFKIVE
jgi:hypothetical protein